jgi:hypothetical protein
MSINKAGGDQNILTSQLQQSTFGTMNDARLLSCHFNDDIDHDGCMEIDDTEYKEISYSKKIRRHSMIQGQDVIAVLSEYGKLVFMTIVVDQQLNKKRFETLTEVQACTNKRLQKRLNMIIGLSGESWIRIYKDWEEASY